MRTDRSPATASTPDLGRADAPRVLLLEADPPTRAVLRAFFADEGFGVVPCASLAEVRAAGRTRPRDVAVADCWPGPRPVPTADERRELARLADVVPLVLLPNQAWASRVTAEDLGVAALLPKPFDLDALLAAVVRLARP